MLPTGRPSIETEERQGLCVSSTIGYFFLLLMLLMNRGRTA